MNTPPAYMPPKKSNTGLIIGLILGGIAVCCVGGVAMIGFFGFRVFKDTIAPITECMTGYQAVSNSLTKYASDHQGRLPSAANWQDELMPYMEKEIAEIKKDAGPFKLMDPRGEWSCTTDKRKTGMAFNIELGGALFEEAKKNDAVVVFEVDTVVRNQSAKYVEQDKSTSPKIMGDRRGWITVRASQGVFMGKQYVGDGFEFKKGNN